MVQLTSFQTDCEGKLQQVLLSFESRLENRHIKGVDEKYIEASIENTGIHIWIYEDEAQFRGEGIDRRYEKPDYNSTEELMADFIDGIAAELKLLGRQIAR